MATRLGFNHFCIDGIPKAIKNGVAHIHNDKVSTGKKFILKSLLNANLNPQHYEYVQRQINSLGRSGEIFTIITF